MREKLPQQNYVDILVKHPCDFAAAVGFTKLTDLHEEWIKKMCWGEGDMTLQASRETYKTTCVAISIAILMILVPNDRILFIRKTDGDVKEIIKQVANILKHPVTVNFVIHIWQKNLRLISENAMELTTNLVSDSRGTAQLVGIGTGGSLTGKHFERIFTDDIVNVKDRVSRAERERTKNVYYELHNVVSKDHGRICNTGTPWHKNDAFEIMPEAEKYNCYDKRVCNVILSEDKLDELRTSMTPSLFAANYELRHIASDDVIFTNPQTGADPAALLNAKCHVDSAFYGEDYTAFTVMAKHDGKYYIFGKLWRKNVEDCYDAVKHYYNRFLCKALYNETNADKGMVARDMRGLGMNVKTYHEKMNKHIKIVTYLKAIWKDVCFVTGTDEDYINQICDYTEDAEHDDAPDSAACMARILNKKDRGYIGFI